MGEAAGGPAFRILMVEDNPADVSLLKLALDRVGVVYELTVIEDGGEAMAFLRARVGRPSPDPDLIVLDLNVPKNDGLEILSYMREVRLFESVPVLVLTSSSSPRERARLEALRIIRHLTKPMQFDEFMGIGAVVKQILEGAGRWRERSASSDS